MKFCLIILLTFLMTSCKETTFPTIYIAYSIDSITSKTIEINNNSTIIWQYPSTSRFGPEKLSRLKTSIIFDTLSFIRTQISYLKNNIAYCSKNKDGQMDLIFFSGEYDFKMHASPIPFPDESSEKHVSRIIQLIENQNKATSLNEELKKDLDEAPVVHDIAKIKLMK